MLDELVVRNLGIIDEARVEPGPGMTVVTGETGTGKTLLLGALRLLVGGTARVEVIGPHGDEARVEGRFVIGDEELAVARRVAKGRSRAYLDGAIATAAAVEERLGGAVEIVGQHDQLMLTTSSELRRLLDRFVDADVVANYHRAWNELLAVRGMVDAVGGDRRSLERELDLISYQVEEIHAAGFNPGDDGVLDSAVSRLRHVEELAEHLGLARSAIETADESLGAAIGELRRAGHLAPDLMPLVEAAETVAVQLSELGSEARTQHEGLEADPAQLAELEQRAAVLADLRRKYGATLEEVLAFAEQAAGRRDQLTELLDGAAELETRFQDAVRGVDAAGEALRAARFRGAEQVAVAAMEHLRDLGFDDPLVEFDIQASEPTAAGADRITLLFASDRRLTLAPVSRVASGGELSRLVLSLRLAAGATDARTVAFDEVDAGVGGSTALELGRKLAALATERQVLCVTHLPQVAAFADTHLVVERTGTAASVRVVEGEDRLEELSRMLSGLPDSELAKDHAEELRRLATRAGS